jgi:hypothetical protein
MRFILFLVCAISATNALAEDVYLGAEGTPEVWVWKDDIAQTEGLRLIEAKVYRNHPEAIDRLLACVVPPGSKAILDENGFFSSRVTVSAGDKAGCQGVVSTEDIKIKPDSLPASSAMSQGFGMAGK